MKLQALMIAAALAAGSALAAAPNTDAKADAAATAAAKTDTTAAPKAAKKSHKKTAKKKHATHVGLHHQGTHAMGAGPSGPMTDLHASSRQARIDQAYANWQAGRR
jgi:hypothetical protein